MYVQREPSAEIRAAAASLRELYIALTMEEFTPQEALVILGQMMSISNGHNKDQ